MSHANAALTPRHRLKVAQLVVDHGWPISEVAARFQVSWPTVKRWADRYRAGQSMQDRSSRPHRSPNKTSPTTAKRCIQLRLRLREGPVQLAYRIGVAPSTVHRILVDVHLNRLSHVDRATGEPVRRYEHDHPGAMLHVDVKKLGNIPDGGGWRYVGRRQGEKNRAATPDKPKNKHYDPLMGKAYRHSGPGQGRQVVQRPRGDRRAGPVGQRWRLSLTPVARHLRRAGNQAQTDQAVSPADQRQDRALPPHPGRRLGLRPLLHLRDGASRRTRRLAALLQPSPAPHSLQQPAALLTIDQRVRSVHLGGLTAG